VEIPEHLAHQVTESNHWSNEAWLPISEDFKGIKVRNMTLADLLILDGIQTPFIYGGDYSDEAAVAFLWVVSEEFSYEETERKDFYKKCVQITILEAVDFIEGYCRKTFAESDTMGKGDQGQTYWVSYFVDLFGKEYSWSMKETLQLPIRICFQMLTAINERASAQNGKSYNRVTELDNTLNRYILHNS
jgi:hypothetical protein